MTETTKEFRPLCDLLAVPAASEVPVGDHIQQQLVGCWRQRAADVALHGRPLLFDSGRLVVFVEAASWGTEIRHRADSLMAILVAEGFSVSSIEVKVLPDSPPPTRKRVNKPQRLSPQSAAQIEQLAGTIEDSQLKASLLRLAKRADQGPE